MSEGENFVARWSRRKRQAEQDLQARKPAPASTPDRDTDTTGDANEPGAARTSAACAEASADSSAPPFDLARLPPLESITAESDVRAFLAPGVPPELTRAALRRVWTADPAIRDFIGLAENAWDFNDPDSISGFGTLEMTEELRRQVARIVGGGLSPDQREAPAATPREDEHPATAVESAVGSAASPDEPVREEQRTCQQPALQPERRESDPSAIARGDSADFATQYDPAKPDEIQAAARPSHGRALPQ
jgi:hypothetical protein